MHLVTFNETRSAWINVRIFVQNKLNDRTHKKIWLHLNLAPVGKLLRSLIFFFNHALFVKVEGHGDRLIGKTHDGSTLA